MLDHNHITKGDIVLYLPAIASSTLELPEQKRFFQVENKKRKLDTKETFFRDRAKNYYPVDACCKIPKGNHCYVKLYCQWYAGRFIKYVGSNPIKAEITVDGEKQVADASSIWFLWGNDGEQSYYDISPCDDEIEVLAILMGEAVRLHHRPFLETLRANFEASTLKEATKVLLNPQVKKQIYEWVVEMNEELSGAK